MENSKSDAKEHKQRYSIQSSQGTEVVKGLFEGV
jgi:hypothetical protein